MIELHGKYNTAKVFTDNIDSETISQVIQLLNQPFISDNTIRIMPDCHAGAGCVVGTTMTLTDKVVPNLVGVDIGCGMYAVKLEEKNIDLKLLDEVIKQYVPSGFDIHETPVAEFDLNWVIAEIDTNNALKSLGTLGGGNHFIEIDKDKFDNLWLVIHTGSRHLGLEVCGYYQDLAYRKCKHNTYDEKAKEIITKLKCEGREKDIETALKDIKSKEPAIPKDLCYVDGPYFKDYINDMQIVQEYAHMNRMTIADQILHHMDLTAIDHFDTIHNYIDTKNMILRKGSVSARKGERLIIPMNMRDGSLICIGKGNPEWNYSAPHGAGRIMSRSQAKDKINMDEYTESMAGIYSTSVTESTIDEAPQVYKPIDEIMENVQDTVEIIDVIKPIYNYKAH